MNRIMNVLLLCLVVIGIIGCGDVSEIIEIQKENGQIQQEEAMISEAVTGGTIVTVTDFYSPELNTNNTLRIYLPYGYEESNKSYPVIYMPDGQNLFSDSTATYGKSWLLAARIDELQKDEKTDGIIIVGIDSTTERTREYNLFMDISEGRGAGLADATCDFYANTVKPYIDSNYRTLSDRKHTGIIGASYGAIVSFNEVVRYPETFGFLGMFSFCDNKSPERMKSFLNENMTKEKMQNTKIYLFTAGNDFARESCISAYNIAKENGVENITFEEDKKGNHDEYTWGPAFEPCLKFWGWIK